MTKPNLCQVVVSYRGIASLLENLDNAPAAGMQPRTESGEESLVSRAPDDPMAALPPAQSPGGPPPQDDLFEFDELQRMAMIRGLRQAVGEIARADKTPGVFFAPDHRAAALLLGFMARNGVEAGKLEEVKDNRYEVRYDDRDFAGWIGSFFRDWYKRLKKHPFIGARPVPEVIGNEARIAILGDWGTGLYGAPVCARSIESATPAFDVILHLGDIYYAGNDEECRARFLDYWPNVAGSMSRALNANHEMYSGGEGYFKQVLPALEQLSSLFALQNDHFLLVGLDTGYDEHDLAGSQIAWLTALVAQAGSRKIVLFSHHQPFSLFESQGKKLVERLRPVLAAKRIFAWYWGHEHRCMIYEKHPEWQMWGRLVGHSGYPYFRRDFSQYPIAQANRDATSWRMLGATDMAPRAVVLEGSNPYVSDAPAKYGPQGWASIHLAGANLLERVHAADGTVLHEKQLA